jgi:light-harvesting complex I chlorophyll a/b binding protein 1
MVKFSALSTALLAGSAAAFSPASAPRNNLMQLNAEKSQALPFMNRPALLDGSMAGDVGFDPLGLSNIDDVGIDLYWLREAEVKHARVAMMAVLGIVQVEIFGPAPGCEAATAKCQMDAFWQIWNSHPQYIAFGLIMITIIETISGIATTQGRESGERAPGDFGLDPLGYAKGDADKFARLQAQEIANGRLAMWAAAGLLMQGCTTHQGGIENLMQSLADNSF